MPDRILLNYGPGEFVVFARIQAVLCMLYHAQREKVSEKLIDCFILKDEVFILFRIQ